jgi:hypothetical protein
MLYYTNILITNYEFGYVSYFFLDQFFEPFIRLFFICKKSSSVIIPCSFNFASLLNSSAIDVTPRLPFQLPCFLNRYRILPCLLVSSRGDYTSALVTFSPLFG